MSKRWKKREESGAASEGDEPPKKSSKAEHDSEDADTIVVCELPQNRKVSVRKWKGMVAVDIREFYSKDGKRCPGKKGISLSIDQWKVLKDHAEEIDKALSVDA